MNIIVCIKQVPGTSNVNIDPKTGTLIRDGAAAKMNPYDLYAIEAALSLAEKFGGSVESLTMGPPQAKAVIQETVCMGARRGTVLTDRTELYIDDLCVDAAMRGRGIGKVLYDYAVEYAREHGYYNLTLNVWACNPSAMRFYEKCGLSVQKIGMELVL